MNLAPPTPLSSPSKTRGFTLVELMVVVAIVGVLAAIGITLARKHIEAGRSAEATNMIQSIRGAQERYRAETQRYLDVSSSLNAYYPRTTPDDQKVPWVNASHADAARWDRLNVTTIGQVMCVYTTVAGGVGTSPDNEALGAFTGLPTFGNMKEQWYLIHAKADVDGDGKAALYLATNLNGEVYVENDGE